jgi:hypothetical protein
METMESGACRLAKRHPISYLADPQGCQIVAGVVGGYLRVAHLGHPHFLHIFSSACAESTFEVENCGQQRARDEFHVRTGRALKVL